MSNVSIGLLDVVGIVKKRWPVLLGAPLFVAAGAYFLLPAPSTIYRGTATLATNGHPTLLMVDNATAAGNATGRPVTVQEDGARILVSTNAQTEHEVKAALEAAMAQFLSAKFIEGNRKADADALRLRTEEELDTLRDALGLLQAIPPTAASGDYTPASYVDSLLPLSSRISELSAELHRIDSQIDLPLAVSGAVAYNYSPERSDSRLVLTVLLALAAGFFTLLWLVALEALQRWERAPRS